VPGEKGPPGEIGRQGTKGEEGPIGTAGKYSITLPCKKNRYSKNRVLLFVLCI